VNIYPEPLNGFSQKFEHIFYRKKVCPKIILVTQDTFAASMDPKEVQEDGLGPRGPQSEVMHSFKLVLRGPPMVPLTIQESVDVILTLRVQRSKKG